MLEIALQFLVPLNIFSQAGKGPSILTFLRFNLNVFLSNAKYKTLESFAWLVPYNTGISLTQAWFSLWLWLARIASIVPSGKSSRRDSASFPQSVASSSGEYIP